MPKYDGTGNVDGFFEVFEEMCEQLGSQGDDRKSFLLSGMKGTVYTWLQDQEGWRKWGYDGLKVALKKEYGQELS